MRLMFRPVALAFDAARHVVNYLSYHTADPRRR